MEDNSLTDMVITTVGVIVTMVLLSCLCCLCMKLSDLKMQRYILEMANRNGVKVDLDKLDSRKPQLAKRSSNQIRNMNSFRLVILTLAAIVLVDQCTYASYINTDNQISSNPHDMQHVGIFRRPRSACIARGESCDDSLMNCCEPTVCRCNLWGSNCRCARAGIV